MAAVAGYGGKVAVDNSDVAQVRNWNADIQREEVDTTHMNDGAGGWRSFISGLGAGTGSMDLNWDMTDTNGQKVLQDAVLNPPTTPPTVKLYRRHALLQREHHRHQRIAQRGRRRAGRGDRELPVHRRSELPVGVMPYGGYSWL